MCRAAAAIAIVVAACKFEAGMFMPPPDDASRTRDGVVDGPGDAPSDAPPADARACPPPPSLCVALACPGSTSCYYVCGTTTVGKQNYAGAKTSCVTSNIGCIVTIDNQAENDCIRDATSPSFPSAMVWIGYEQALTGAEPAGGWGWACGSSTFVAPNWGDPNGEPNEDGNEDCATMIQGGEWIDATCTGTSRFVCELP